MASLVLGAVGAVAGFYLGGPVGASIGWSLGSLAGNALFPNQQNTEGPRIADNAVQGSTYGAMIPIVLGTDRVSGQLMWRGERHEHQHTSGGKGGGPTSTTFSYTRSFAILLCKGPMAGVVKLWADGRLIYDGTQAAPFTFYPGNSTQLPDPVMEAAKGVGEVSAHRGNCYLVFEEFDETPYGRIPNFSALVTDSIAHNIGRITSWDPEYPDHPLTDEPTDDNLGQGPRNPSVSYDGNAITVWRYQGEGYGGDAGKELRIGSHRIYTKRYSELGNLISSSDSGIVQGGTDNIISNGSVFKCTNRAGWYFTTCGEFLYERHPGSAPGRTVWADLYTSSIYKDQDAMWCTTDWVASWDGSKAYMLGNKLARNSEGDPQPNSGAILRKYTLPSPVMGSPDHSFLILDDSSTIANGDQWAVGIDSDGSIWVCGVYQMYHLDGDDLSVIASWDWDSIQTETGNNYHRYGRDIGDHPCFCNGKHIGVINTGEMAVDEVTATAPYITRITTIPFLAADVIGESNRYGPCFALGNGLVWVRDGMISICADKGGTTTLGAIVSAISQMEPEPLDPSEFDVTELGDIVDGFKIGQQMSKRAAIEALQSAYYFDALEEDGIVKFPKRGKGPCMEIDDADLGAVNEGSEPIAPIAYTRADEADLPKSASVTYEDKDFDYQPGNVSQTRQYGNAQKALTLELAIVMDNVKAKQIVQTILFNMHMERDTGDVSLPASRYLVLSPTDVVTARGIDYRINQSDAVPYSTIKLALARTQANAWSSGGSAGTGSTGGGGVGSIVYPQHTALAVLDIPYIVDPAQQDVISVAMSGIDRSGAGATLFKSIDGGTNYTDLVSSLVDDAMGTADNVLPNFAGGNVFDEGGVAYVTMTKGSPDLSSTTRAGMFRGENDAMLGRERIQFRDVALISASPKQYKLTGLLRGRGGTGLLAKTHAIGEDFILLPTQTRLVVPYADHGLTRQYKAVTSGQPVAQAAAHDLTSQGVPLAPWPPVHLRAGFDGSGNVLLGCRRRARLNNEWLDIAEIPLGEATESYRWRIFADGTYQVVKRVIITSTPECTYTVAQQTTDFGGALTSPPAFGVAQIGTLGPGYEAPTGYLPAFIPVSGGGGIPPVNTGFLSTMNWASPALLQSSSVGALVTGSVWSIQFTTGSTPNPDVGHMVKISAAEYQGPPTLRMGTLSPIRGDFGPQAAFLANAGPSTSITFYFGVGGGPVSTPNYPSIPFNTTMYMNILTIGGEDGVDNSMLCEMNKIFV